jgi:uncharacterized membrane protein YsdA (DUF1294 family)
MPWEIILIWIAILSVYTFIAMGWDKRKARKKNWRISEKHFFVVSALGGSIGVLLGMKYWRHKTHKWVFKGPIYAIGTIQLLLSVYLLFVMDT